MAPELTPYLAEVSWGDRLKTTDALGIPFVAYVRELREGLVTEYSPNGDGRAVVLDLVNLATREILINVHWFNGAIVDGLKNYIGTLTAIRLTPTQGKSGSYPKPEPLSGNDYNYAVSWVEQNPDTVDQARARREAEEGRGQQQPSTQAQMPATAPSLGLQASAPTLPQVPQSAPQAPIPPVLPPAPAPSAGPGAVAQNGATPDPLAGIPEAQRAAVLALLAQTQGG